MPKGRRRNRGRSKGKRTGNSGGNKGARQAWRGPPPYIVGRKVNMHIRYYAIAAQTDTITGKNLLNCLSMAATTTTSYRFFSALKIKSFEMWAGGNVGTGAAGAGVVQPGISFEWYQVTGTAFTNSTKVSDNAEPGKPAFLRVRPPKGSSQSFWISSGGALDTNDTIIAVSVGVGVIIDFHFQACIVDDDTVFGAEAPVAATVGKVYYDYLDGRSSGNLSPVSVNVIPSPWGPTQNVGVGGYVRYPEDVQKRLWKLVRKAQETDNPLLLEKASQIALEASSLMSVNVTRRSYVPVQADWPDISEDLSEEFIPLSKGHLFSSGGTPTQKSREVPSNSRSQLVRDPAGSSKEN